MSAAVSEAETLRAQRIEQMQIERINGLLDDARRKVTFVEANLSMINTIRPRTNGQQAKFDHLIDRLNEIVKEYR